LTGFEALLRWRHPHRGLVPPDQFIPMAEETGLIGLLGDWVLRTACRDAAEWVIPGGCERPSVAVNVSPFQLNDEIALIDGIKRALAESGLPPERLELELTESAMAGDVVNTLHAIRRLGVGLALDDFGTGYSSLGRLRTLPFTKLKIDRSFVVGLGVNGDETEQATGEWMIRAVASLGIGLKMKTIVEGIETTDQAAIARRVGCLEMQGYLVSRPVPCSAVNEIILRLHNTASKEGCHEF
jgi:EAL domain-containing protein (putative c-di-GMP-specific phosphodiesterase class I)